MFSYYEGGININIAKDDQTEKIKQSLQYNTIIILLYKKTILVKKTVTVIKFSAQR